MAGFLRNAAVWTLSVSAMYGSAAALDGNASLQLSTLNGWQAFELITEADDISELSDAGYGPVMTRGIFDGIGLYRSNSILSINVNHEEFQAAISRVDVDLASLRQAIDSMVDGQDALFPEQIVTGVGYAYNAIYDKNYHAANNPVPVAIGTEAVGIYSDNFFSRLCSGTSYLPHSFGTDRGFRDAIYLTGEETFDSFGQFFALDQATRNLWETPDFGTSSWENAALVDTGNTTHVAVVLNADIQNAPLRVYVGEKGVDANDDGVIDFLERNGLRGGSVHFFHPVEGASLTNLPDGQVAGGWSLELTGALREDKLEDVHTNPNNPTQVVFADQSDGVYVMDLDLQFSDGQFDADASGALITQIDDSLVAPIGNPDNLTWSADGKIYVQEDGDGNDIWQIEADGSSPLHLARALSEPSGIVDVSQFVGYRPGGVFLTSIQGVAQLTVLISPDATLEHPFADFDGDDRVAGRDLLEWQFGRPAVDINFDGFVNGLDLAAWQQQYGQVVAVSAPEPLAAPLPEPTAALLVTLGGFYVLDLRVRSPASGGAQRKGRKPAKLVAAISYKQTSGLIATGWSRWKKGAP